MNHGLRVRGNNDATGAVSSIERLAIGLSPRKATDVLAVAGRVDVAVRERAHQLAAPLPRP